MSEDRRLAQTSQASQFRRAGAAFVALLILTAAVRLVAVGRPLLGPFATKNVVYAMISRNLAEGRADVWHPTLDLLTDGGRAWHMLEFPVSAYLTAGLWRVFGGSLDVWGRLTAVAFSVLSVAVMFLFVRRRHGPTAATAASFALAVSPVSIIYGQSFMLEASLVCFTLVTFYALDRWLASMRYAWLAVASVSLALLLLTKVYMLIVVLPLAASVWARRSVARCVETHPTRLAAERSEAPDAASSRGTAALCPGHPAAGMWATLAIALAILPAALWYVHAWRTGASDGPGAERVYYSVRQSTDVHFPPDPRLASGEFYRQLLDDLTGVALTPIGFTLALAGLFHRDWRRYAPWLAAMLVLVIALPRKFQEMNYYMMAVLPPLCIMVALGWDAVCRRMRPSRTGVCMVVVVSLALSFRYAAKPAFVTPEEDRGVVEAAGVVRQLTDEDEPVATMHGTTLDLLYYCGRGGWALDGRRTPEPATLEECRRQGARYLVVVGEPPPLPGYGRHHDHGQIWFLPEAGATPDIK